MIANNRDYTDNEASSPGRNSNATAFALSSLFLSITLFGICLALFQLNDVIGTVLACVLLPAWLIAVVQIARKSRRKSLTVPERLDQYFEGIKVMATVAGIFALVLGFVAVYLTLSGRP